MSDVCVHVCWGLFFYGGLMSVLSVQVCCVLFLWGFDVCFLVCCGFFMGG